MIISDKLNVFICKYILENKNNLLFVLYSFATENA